MRRVKLMKKLSFYLLLVFILYACSTTKHVPVNEQLLTDNTIIVDNKEQKSSTLNSLLLQRPNAKAIGLPLSLYFYNLGNPKGSQDVSEWRKNHPRWYNLFKDVFSQKQSDGVAGSFIRLNNWFLSNGQPPVIINKTKTRKTVKNLQNYFQSEGYFHAKVWNKQDTIGAKKGAITYFVDKDKPSFLDTITFNIKSKVLDSLYNTSKHKSFLKAGDQYKVQNFKSEANRIVKLFRNNGIFHFNENYIEFLNDTTGNYQKTKVELGISNRLIEENGGYVSKPFKIQKLKKVKVYTDYTYNKRNEPYQDSLTYKGVTYYAHKKLRYNPKYLGQSIFIRPDQTYSDSLRNISQIHLRGLRNFKSTSIRYNPFNNQDDALEAQVLLTPVEKYSIGIETELSRSNIRNFDISAKFSISNRNTFKGAEIFNLSVLGSYFNSRNGAGWELGGNVSLEVPRFMAPFGFHRLVPKRMQPRTTFTSGLSIQKNIALDKQNISLGVDYKWQFNKKKSIQLELLNAQYIRNLNVSNYFNIYNSEYSKLVEIGKNTIPGTPVPQNTSGNFDAITNYANLIFNSPFLTSKDATTLLNIINRYGIITSDFLIPEIAYTYTYNNQENPKDADFSYFRIRLANSGNVMGLLSNQTNSNGQKTVFKIPVAQYFKTDLEYKKFWDLGQNNILAHRTFLGAIITYNGSSIPFSRSYFAGGSNDIRAWRTYDLGPGRSLPGLEYNIGSLKFLTSFEYRFDIAGSLKSAIFVDAGNIWDITNSSSVDRNARFLGVKSLTDMAVGAGFGIRYDLKFLVARLDLGFKVREPYLTQNRWFQNFNFSNAIYNIGINYPF